MVDFKLLRLLNAMRTNFYIATIQWHLKDRDAMKCDLLYLIWSEIRYLTSSIDALNQTQSRNAELSSKLHFLLY